MIAATSRQQFGLTMVEHLIVLVIVSLLVGAAWPSLQKLSSQRRLESAAAQLESNLQWARSSSISMGQRVHLTFATTGSGSCYVAFTGESNECSCSPDGSTFCTGNAHALHTGAYPSDGHIQIASRARSLAFEGNFGTVTPTTTIEVRDQQSRTLRVVINIVGRIRMCSPNSAVPGFPAC